MNRIGEGDRVICRYFNTPEKVFYGEKFGGVVLSVKPTDKGFRYEVKKDNGFITTLWRKEILYRVKKEN